MRYTCLSAVGLCLALALPAAAQTSSNDAVKSGSPTPKMSGNSSTQANASTQNGNSQNGSSSQDQLGTQANAGEQNGSSQNGTSSQYQPGTQANAQGQKILQHIVQDLKQAGFTNIKIMPESFLVRATDKEGNPTMMVVNPDSVFAVSEANNGAGSGTQQSGSNNQNNGSGTSNSTAQ